MVCGEMKFTWLCFALILVPNLGGWIGGVAVNRNMDWYKALNKSEFSPPGWVFGPVWTILYCLMGFASYLVWEERKLYLGRQTTSSHPESHELGSTEARAVKAKSRCTISIDLIRRKSWIPLVIYVSQLLLNWVWTWIFFECRLQLVALIEIFILDITVAVCLICFGIVRLTAGALLVPYMAWLMLATVLNFDIYIKNDKLK